jgi:hypothetical protein
MDLKCKLFVSSTINCTHLEEELLVDSAERSASYLICHRNAVPSYLDSMYFHRKIFQFMNLCILKALIVWDVTPCYVVDGYHPFKGTRYLYLHGRRNFLWMQAVPWLRQLLAGLLPLRPRFDPRSALVGFMVDKVALCVLPFSPVIIPPMLHAHTFIYHWCHKILAIDGVIKSHTPVKCW